MGLLLLTYLVFTPVYAEPENNRLGNKASEICQSTNRIVRIRTILLGLHCGTYAMNLALPLLGEWSKKYLALGDDEI